MNNTRTEKFHFTVLDFSEVKQSASHGFEFFDLFAKDVLGKLEMGRKAGKTEEFCGTAVNQFTGQRCFIL